MADHLGVAACALLRKRHKKLQANKSPRPLYRVGIRVEHRPRLLAGQVGNIRAKSLRDTLRMTAEEHSAAHRNRKPLMRIAGDRVCVSDAIKEMLQARNEDRAASPGGVDMKPQPLLATELSDSRQRI